MSTVILSKRDRHANRYRHLPLMGCAAVAASLVLSACAAGEQDVAATNSSSAPTEMSSETPVSPQGRDGADTQAAAGEIYLNSVGMEFIPVPAGTFLMGSDDSDPEATDAEKPQHEVTISEAFDVGRFEVTQQQWEAVMGSNPYTLDRSNPFYNLPGMAERITRPDHPATVSWNDAQDFLERLNALEGGNRYRLPTEAEWEYAARAGTNTPYSFGSNEADLDTYAWYGEGFDDGGTHPVGQKDPNPWGLFDVHGNAWEWTGDVYDAGYYETSPAVDPTGPAEGSEHVVRGGSWHTTATSWRTAFRRDYDADYRGISIGFRVIRTTE
ncbi:formylglycine-generating enzyme family protein [Arthrobacter sp. MDT1-65]